MDLRLDARVIHEDPCVGVESRNGATDVLVNMTSVGMHPNVAETPVPAEILRGMIVFDGVYNPPETLLLRSAAQNGCCVLPGIEMFINQAALQLEQFTR